MKSAATVDLAEADRRATFDATTGSGRGVGHAGAPLGRSGDTEPRPGTSAAYPYLWSQQQGGWWGNHPIPCRIVKDEGARVKIAALRPDGVELERFVKKERLRRV